MSKSNHLNTSNFYFMENNSIDSRDCDAARYRWIKSKKNLTLATSNSLWFKESGEPFYCSHFLNVNETGFNGIENLDDLIDQAMEMYP